MSVAISSLSTNLAKIATLADAATGRPDGRTTVAEVDAFLAAFPDADRLGAWWELKRQINETEIRVATTPERQTQLEDLAVELARSGEREAAPFLARRGVTLAHEQVAVDRLWRLYYSLSSYYARPDQTLIDEVAVDGVVNDAERVLLRDSIQITSKENDYPGARRVLGLATIDLAERRARQFNAAYGEAVRGGVVPGVSATTPLQPPSPESQLRLRDGSMMKQLAEAPRTAARALLESHKKGWPNISLFVDQYRVDDLAKALVDRWDVRDPTQPSSQRVVQAIFGWRDAPSRDQDARAAIASAIMRRLSDEQLRNLDLPTTAALGAGLSGGTSPNVVSQNLTQMELAADLVFTNPVDGPRTFGSSVGSGPLQTADLERLRRLTSARFTWVEDKYRAPSFNVSER